MSENNGFLFGTSKKDDKSDTFDILLFAKRDIKHVLLPPFVTCICSYSFCGCQKIQSFEISNDSKLQTKNDSAFNITSIKNLTFPNFLSALNKGWSLNMNKLKKIVISPKNENFRIYNKNFLLGKTDKNGQ